MRDFIHFYDWKVNTQSAKELPHALPRAENE